MPVHPTTTGPRSWPTSNYLREAGGTVVEERTDEMSRWIVMLDPEGNEFCVQ